MFSAETQAPFATLEARLPYDDTSTKAGEHKPDVPPPKQTKPLVDAGTC